MTFRNHDPIPILLVDDEPQLLLSSSAALRSSGIRHVVTVNDSRKVLPLLANEEIAVVVLDLRMPYLSGTELLPQITSEYPHLPVIVMTALNELSIAVECMKAGAFDYLVKPVEKNRFASSVKRALELLALRNELSSLKQSLLSGKLEHENAFSSMITKSKSMRAIFQYIESIAGTKQSVLIGGETGSGKELIAESVHDLSGRRGEFVAVNVAGLDDTMLADTLYGHRKGAYTGADKTREGLIAKASGGTLFLDEIGDMNETSQIKLLRLLQEERYYPLGSDVSKQSDVRIVVATHQELPRLIAAGKFRKDLYYRLRAHQILLPPLRERLEDLPLLVNHFLEQAAESMGKKKPTPPPELFILLSTYAFPGNIRELQTMVFDAVAQHHSGILSMQSFQKIIGQKSSLSTADLSNQTHPAVFSLDDSVRFPTLKEAEEYLMAKAMEQANGNQGIAATLLGISRQALNKRLTRKATRS
jgi:DNA-binding NtrC family response regulator